MAMSVVYSNFCGMVVSETRGGVERDYVCDTLGSTIGLMDPTGTMTDRWEYWPCGEVVSHSGTSTTPLTFLGVLGYFKDVLDKLFYVRARHLRVDLARWLTVDPLWPTESSYAYSNNAPVLRTDPTGLSCLVGCINKYFLCLYSVLLLDVGAALVFFFVLLLCGFLAVISGGILTPECILVLTAFLIGSLFLNAGAVVKCEVDKIGCLLGCAFHPF